MEYQVFLNTSYDSGQLEDNKPEVSSVVHKYSSDNTSLDGHNTPVSALADKQDVSRNFSEQFEDIKPDVSSLNSVVHKYSSASTSLDGHNTPVSALVDNSDVSRYFCNIKLEHMDCDEDICSAQINIPSNSCFSKSVEEKNFEDSQIKCSKRDRHKMGKLEEIISKIKKPEQILKKEETLKGAFSMGETQELMPTSQTTEGVGKDVKDELYQNFSVAIKTEPVWDDETNYDCASCCEGEIKQEVPDDACEIACKDVCKAECEPTSGVTEGTGCMDCAVVKQEITSCCPSNSSSNCYDCHADCGSHENLPHKDCGISYNNEISDRYDKTCLDGQEATIDQPEHDVSPNQQNYHASSPPPPFPPPIKIPTPSRKQIALDREKHWEKVGKAMVEARKGTSIRKAAKMFGVPESTVRKRLKSHVDGQEISIKKKSYSYTTFTEEQEILLLTHCRQMARLGYGYAPWQVIEQAQNMAILANAKVLPTKEWFNRYFMKRHPDFKTVSPKKRDKARTVSDDKIINDYFTELETTMDKYDLKDKPLHIWNLDETGVSLDHTPPKVLSYKHDKVHMITAGKSPNTTLISAVNAVGHTLPPYFIFKGKRDSEEMKVDTLEGTIFKSSDSGWSNSEIFLNFMITHFIKYINIRPILLLYDGHTTHYPSVVIERAKAEQIHLFVLPPHSSHILQPQDVSVFGVFKRKLHTNIHKWMFDHPLQTIQREQLPGMICTAMKTSMSVDVIMSGFRKTGIFPLNRMAVPH